MQHWSDSNTNKINKGQIKSFSQLTFLKVAIILRTATLNFAHVSPPPPLILHTWIVWKLEKPHVLSSQLWMLETLEKLQRMPNHVLVVWSYLALYPAEATHVWNPSDSIFLSLKKPLQPWLCRTSAAGPGAYVYLINSWFLDYQESTDCITRSQLSVLIIQNASFATHCLFIKLSFLAASVSITNSQKVCQYIAFMFEHSIICMNNL